MSRPSADTAARSHTEHQHAGIAAVVASSLILASGSTIVKYSDAPGVVIAFWRSWAITAVWLTIVFVRKVRFTRDELRKGLLVGLLFGGNMCVFFSSVRLTRVANVEFVSALSPILLVTIGFVLLRERIPPVVLAAGGLALAGSLMVLLFAKSTDDRSHWFGNVLAVLTALSWVGYLFAARWARKYLSTAQLMACVMGGAAVVTTVIVLVFDRTGTLADGPLTGMTGKAWFVIGLSTVMNGMIAHTMLTWAQSRVPMSTIGLIQIAQPVLGTTYAWLILDESIQPKQVIGMAAVVVAMAVVSMFVGRIAPRSDTDR